MARRISKFSATPPRSPLTPGEVGGQRERSTGYAPHSLKQPKAGGWALYDGLLEAVPDADDVHRVLVGQLWTLVASTPRRSAGTSAEGAQGAGLGIAMTHHTEYSGELLCPPYGGRPLREVAAFVRSWNVREAAIGLAAINSHFNTPERVEQTFGRELTRFKAPRVFRAMRQEIEGKKVAVVGHFEGVEALAKHCRLTILERHPRPGDLPDFAAEYVLPEQDYVFITGTTLINKTLPRLLELSRRAKTILVGPSVPLTPRWFDLGVSVLAGAVAVKPEEVWRAAAEAGLHDLFTRGVMTVQLRAEDYRRPRSTKGVVSRTHKSFSSRAVKRVKSSWALARAAR